jgi:hypothetical protein
METTSTQKIGKVVDSELLTAPVLAYLSAKSVPAATNWHASIITFALTLILSALVIEATLAALDPYDTGRFAFTPLWHDRGIANNASRGRDTAFNSAIFGSSRMDMVQPKLLDKATGLRFVSFGIILPLERSSSVLTIHGVLICYQANSADISKLGCTTAVFLHTFLTCLASGLSKMH